VKRKLKQPLDHKEIREDFEKMAASDRELANRTYNVPTQFMNYLVRFRHGACAESTLPKLAELESQANELWMLSDSKEMEDLIEHLLKNPPSPELIAMVMLTGRSMLKIKKATSKGGKIKNMGFTAMKTQAESEWKAVKSTQTKSQFADKFVAGMYANRKGEQPRDIPEPGTVRKWLSDKNSRNK
jgi:hypothetical protein